MDEQRLQQALARLLKPRSLAIVGASPEPFSVGNNLLVNLRRFSFAGDLHLVSRSRSDIDGIPCVASIDELPDGIDAAVLIVPAQAVGESLAACARRKMGGVVVFASGFSEQDDAGAKMQNEFAAMAREAGLAVLGPNCIGSVNYTDGVPLTFEPVEPCTPKGAGVCVIAQSGAMQGNIRYALMGRGVPVAHSISTGNEAVISAEDFLDLLIADDGISCFSLFVEQIRNPQRFLKLASRAKAHGKPIILLHPGKSTEAAEAARSHTGALAGDHAMMKAFVERAGVIVVSGLDELFDVTTLVARYPKPVTGGVAVLSNSGALRGFSLDFCAEIGLQLPTLAPMTQQRLQETLPSFATISNPLDITAAGMQKPSLFGDSAAALLDDPAIGFLLVAAMGGGKPQQLAKWHAMKPVLMAAQKPVAVTYMGDDYPLDATFMEEMRASGLPFFRSPDRALRAIARLSAHGSTQSLIADSAQTCSLVVSGASGTLAEWKGKDFLQRLSIKIPRGALAKTVEEAQMIARDIGYPVVMKAQSDRLAHKSEAGGVVINIASDEALRDAWTRLEFNIRTYDKNLQLDGILVEEMALRGATEMIVGAKRDANWSPMLVVGLGGIWTEALHDAVSLPATAGAAEIEHALTQLKGAAILRGLRGEKPRDVEALVDLILKVGALMRSNEKIAEIDINPVNLYAQGHGCVALDALFVME